MGGVHSSGDGETGGEALFPRVASDRLRSAATRILDTWDDPSSRRTAGKERVAGALLGIVRDVERIRSGREAAFADREIPKLLLHRRLADALGTELIRQRASGFDDEDAPASEATLELLAALEEYRGALRGGDEDELVASLTEPEAMDLVVEVAHDLRSPLNSILFLSEALRSGHTGPVNENQRSQLGLIYSATLGMISVVSDVMELASEGKGTADEDPTVFSIREVLESVEEMVRPMADESEVSLEFRRPEYDRCIGHPLVLGRVLLNLTTNALKFTDEGKVTVSAERLDPVRIQFSVRDTGRGILPEKLPGLFSPLRKSAAREGYFFSRSGLGLSIARRLLAAMDSELEIETGVGEGTCFSFELELPPPGSAL